MKKLLIFILIILVLASGCKTYRADVFTTIQRNYTTINTGGGGGSGDAINDLLNETRCVTQSDTTINCSSGGLTAMFFDGFGWYFENLDLNDIYTVRSNVWLNSYLYFHDNEIQSVVSPLIIDGTEGIIFRKNGVEEVSVESSKTTAKNILQVNSSGADAFMQRNAADGIYDAYDCYQLDGVSKFYQGVDDSNLDKWTFGTGCTMGSASGLTYDGTTFVYGAAISTTKSLTVTQYFEQVFAKFGKDCVNCDVSGASMFQTQGTTPTFVVNFTNPHDGKIHILCTEANTRFQNGTQLRIEGYDQFNCTKLGDYCDFYYFSASNLAYGTCTVI